MFSPPEVGAATESRHIVTEADTANAWGNAGIHVLASPRLLHWVESTIAQLWPGRVEAGQVLLGTEFHLHHTGPAVLGSTVTVRASVSEIDRRRYRYRFDAFDHAGPIGDGWSENYLMPRDAYEQRLDRRAAHPLK